MEKIASWETKKLSTISSIFDLDNALLGNTPVTGQVSTRRSGAI